MNRRGGRPQGFSLLEMLVVLVLMGLMVSLVGARVQGPMDGATRQFELDLITQWLGNVGAQARVTGQGRVLTQLVGGETDSPPQLSAGWSLAFDPPLRVSAHGTCSDSRVTAVHEAAERTVQTRFHVLALDCKIASDDAQ